MKQTPTLKPCPFCGREAFRHPRERDNSVSCKNRACPMQYFWMPFDTWNKRPGEKKARQIALDDARRALDGAGDVSGVNAWEVISNLMEIPKKE